MNKNPLLFIAGISGALVVAIGALGAHSLKPYLPPDALVSYETAVRYQFYHTLALLVIGLLQGREMPWHVSTLKWAGWLFVAGIIFFSGSVYFLSTKTITGLVNISFLGPVTPIGGLLFIAGWVMVALAAVRKP